MGSQESKKIPDPNIQIYVDSKKPFYMAGDHVEGCVYLNVKAMSSYNTLSILVLGNEYIHLRESAGNTKLSRANRSESYRSSFLLKDFGGRVEQGQYLFPFIFRIPEMMCSSFYHQENCYIKYVVQAQLTHPSDATHSQVYDMPLNVIQPIRGPKGQIKICTTTDEKMTITMTCDKNEIYSGQSFFVKGLIDNSKGSGEAFGCRFVLEQKIIKIPSSSGYATQHFVVNQWPMHELKPMIKKGQVREFQFEQTMPRDIIDNTAIGRVTAMYFILKFEAEHGCCTSNSQAVFHLIVHAKNPKITTNPQFEKPNPWNPFVSQPIVCDNMKPYVLNPLPQIPYHNLPGNVQPVPHKNQMYEDESYLPTKENYNNRQDTQQNLSYPQPRGYPEENVHNFDFDQQKGQQNNDNPYYPGA